MYKPPISITHDDYMKKYVEQIDSSIFMAIERKFEANIDRDELIKALNYDRGQYEKGFADGVASAQPTWISCAERLPDKNEVVLGWSELTRDMFTVTEHYFSGFRVTHWMPLPMPPKGDE